MGFGALHIPGHPFIMPNPWDVGSAKMLAALGFPALASTSAGAAYAAGTVDGGLSLEEKIRAAVLIRDASGLPVSADLENGGGDSPKAAARAVRLAIGAGLDGASIEDLDAEGETYPFDLALERIHAAMDARVDTDLVLTARAEGMLKPDGDFDDVLRRIEAFAKAGADVVFAPGLATAAQIADVVATAGHTPVNVLIGNNAVGLRVADLAELGVARISIGSGLARAAYGAMIDIAKRMRDTGEFRYPDTTAGFADVEALLAKA